MFRLYSVLYAWLYLSVIVLLLIALYLRKIAVLYGVKMSVYVYYLCSFRCILLL